MKLNIIGVIIFIGLIIQFNYAVLPACTNNWAGGACVGSVTYTSSMSLSSGVNVSGTITINTAVIISTNAWSMWSGGTITDSGTIKPPQTIAGAEISSDGGSGGGGGSEGGTTQCFIGTSGSATIAAGGTAAGCSGHAGLFIGLAGNPGSTGGTPSPSVANIRTWTGTGGSTTNMAADLGGALGGKGGDSSGGQTTGGDGSYGQYIQGSGVTITSTGTITTVGATGQSGTATSSGAGGGGSGWIIIGVGAGGLSNSGTISDTGGAGGAANGGAKGGAGGNGGESTYSYGGSFPLIPVTPPTATAPTPTNPIGLTGGESVTLTSHASGGTGALTITWFTNSACTGGNVGSGTTLTVAPTETVTYYYFVVDAVGAWACSPGSTLNIGFQQMAVDPSPSQYSISPFYGIGNTINFTGSASGGIYPYTFQWWGRVPGNTIFTKIGGATTANYLWTPTTASQLGIYQFMLQATDASSANVVNSITGSITLVAVPTVTITNTVISSPIQAGQLLNITADIVGGQAPYSYNFIVQNSVTKKILASYQFNGIYKSNWTDYINPLAVWKGNTIEVNVLLNDSETLPQSFNSIFTASWLVNAQNNMQLYYGTTNSINYGQSIQAEILPPIAGDYTRWAYGTNIINYQEFGQFNITLPILQVGSYIYNAIDLSQSISTVNVLVVNRITPILELTTPSNMLYSGGGGNIIVSIDTLNSQIPANVWINGVNIGSTSTTLAVNTIPNVGQYVIVVNTLGGTNYTPASISTTFNIWTLSAGTGISGLGSSTTITNAGVTSLTGSGGFYVSSTTGAVVGNVALYTGLFPLSISNANVISCLTCWTGSNYNSMYIDSIIGSNGIQSKISGQQVTLGANVIPPLTNWTNYIGVGYAGNIFLTNNQINSLNSAGGGGGGGNSIINNTIITQTVYVPPYLLPIIFVIISLLLFVIGLLRFPMGSFQNIILLVVAALAMYLGTSFYSIQNINAIASYPQQIIQNPSGGNTIVSAYNISFYTPPVNAKINQLYWLFTTLYDIICCVFALIGLIIRFYRGTKT